MLRVRTHGHASPRVHTSRIRSTVQSQSSGPPLTVQAKRASPKRVWFQRNRRLRATYQIQQRPRVGKVSRRATKKGQNRSRPRPVKSNRSPPKYEFETRNAWRRTTKNG